MFLWRISNHADLLGTGGMLAPARWHTAGRPVVYLADHPATALLEVLVHLELDEEHRPGKYQLLKIEVDDAVAYETVLESSLPASWKEREAETQLRGDEWLALGSTALLRVPSAITPETWNWMLNPRHADAAKVRVLHAEKHAYDLRLFRR